jgi:uncharacterized tellurite resistance protein B-like protein
MLRGLKRLLGGGAAGDVPAAGDARAADDEFRIAAAALLIEAANADDRVHLLEQAAIAQGLAWHFGLDAAAVEDLLTRAERARRDAVDMHRFTAVLVRGGQERERLALVEAVWRVVLADGELTGDESILARRIGNLLDLRPEDVAGSIRRARGERTPYPTDRA